MNQQLKYSSPARDWLEGLPIGNGRLAAMINGTVKQERIALNHEWLWRGKNRLRDNEKCAHLLEPVRKLLLGGNYEEGTKAGNDAFGGGGGLLRDEKPCRVDAYQPAGDLYFEINHGVYHSYQRTLDFETASVSVSYQADQRKFIREYFAHLVEDLILVRIHADGDSFDCKIWLDRIVDPKCELVFSANTDALIMDGNFKSGTGFRIKAQVKHSSGEALVTQSSKLEITNTQEVIIAINIGTSVYPDGAAKECDKTILRNIEWSELYNAHVNEHQKHYGGLEIDIPYEKTDIPTDERIGNLRNGTADPALILLYFNFGRYLLCASSAIGQLPANLQGKWNEDIDPPWQCDYHHDINLQMNYWVAEPTGMQNYVEALLQHIERFVPHARKAARDLYGCEGVWFPIQTDAWGRSTPESYGWAVWIGAAAWLAQHMWWHYEYGQDVEFLQSRCYPFIKEVAAFYESYLIEDENQVLQFVPSQSPENRFAASGNRFPVSLCVSSSMDIQLAWDVLTHTVKASEILKVDENQREKWWEMLAKLPKLKIGTKGQLLEWNREVEEVEPGHRHISHLYGLFPGEQFHPEKSPEMFNAALKSLEIRMAHSGGHTGWSRAWTSCCYARAGDGDKAFEHLEHLITDFVTDSLLDLHPPRIFQIEGNLGGAAAVTEMLLQSYYEELHLLPALPKVWPQGKVHGLRARGGYSVNIEWNDYRLVKAEITPFKNRLCRIKTGNRPFTVEDESGQPVKTTDEDNHTVFDVKANRTYIVKP